MKTIDDLNLMEEPAFTHDEENDDVSKLQNLLKELDLSGGVARIFRQKPNAAQFDYEGELPVDGFSLETIKKAYGGGLYNIRFAAKGGRYVRSVRFSIDSRHIGSLSELKTEMPSNNSTNDNSALLAMMMQQQQSQQAQQSSMMTLMVTMMTESQKSMAGVMAAAIGGNRMQNVTPDHSSKIIEMMTPIMIESMKPRGGMSEMAENIKMVKELIGSEKEEKEQDMLDKLMQVGAPLLGAFMNRNQPQPQPQPVQRIEPPKVETPESLAKDRANKLLQKLKFITPILVRAANKNTAIESYVDILNDSLDEEGMKMLVYSLQQPEWVAILFNNNPEVLANFGWFENFRDMILNPNETEDNDIPETSSPFITKDINPSKDSQ